jgi:hypothetical protein
MVCTKWFEFFILSCHIDRGKNLFLGASVKIAKNDCYFLYFCLSVRLSVCLSVRPSAWNNSAPIGRIFIELLKLTVIFFISVRPSVCLSVRPSAWNNSAPTGRILIKLLKITYFLYFCPSVRPHGTTQLPLEEFS